MPETVNRNHLYASTIHIIQRLQSLNTRTLHLKKKKKVQHVKHRHQTIQILTSFQSISEYKPVNSRGCKTENLVFVTVSKIYYRKGWLRKRKKWKKTQNDQENANMFYYEYYKELLKFRSLPSFQIA